MIILASACLSILSLSLGVIQQAAAAKNNFLPWRGKVLLTIFSVTSLLVRLVAIMLYFAPSLGIINLLWHWKIGQKDSKMIKPFDVIEGKSINFEDVWVITPNYTDYTIFGLWTYYVAFMVLATIHFALIFVLKWKTDSFKSTANQLDRIHHVLTQLFVPTNFEDWDDNELTSMCS